MSIVAFAPRQLRQDGTWQASELNAMQNSFAAVLASGEAGGWHTAATEVGDPQLYLLGPQPDEHCILSITRIGRVYILEDGAGHVVCEDTRLERLIEHAKTFLRGAKGSVVARIMLVCASVRQIFEEKIEPILAESEEFLLHVAPQLAAAA
jgi:hypothetical protein